MSDQREYPVPFYNFSVVVERLDDDSGWVASDNGHTEISLLSKYDSWFISPQKQNELLRRLGVTQNEDREFVARAIGSNAQPVDAAKKLIAGILYLAVHREYGPKPLMGFIEIG